MRFWNRCPVLTILDVKHVPQYTRYKFNKAMYETIIKAWKYKTRKETKPKFYKTMAVSVALYGIEACALSKRDRRKIRHWNKTFSRAIKGWTLADGNNNASKRLDEEIFSFWNKITKWNQARRPSGKNATGSFCLSSPQDNEVRDIRG